MLLTIKWMADNFARFNREYFRAELPTPRFIIISNANLYGQSGAMNWRAKHPNFELRLSNYWNRTEYQYKCTLLHEMIHLYWQARGEWNVGHGEKFVEMALHFRQLGWNIILPDGAKPDRVKKNHTNNNRKREDIQPRNTQYYHTTTSSIQEKDAVIYSQASLRWQTIWCNQIDNGIQLHCNFLIDGMKKIPCEIKVSLYFDYIMNNRILFKEMVNGKLTPVINAKKALNPLYDSTIYNDLVFEFPYSKLLLLDSDSFLSRLTFNKEMNYVVVFQILYKGKLFKNTAFYLLGLLGKNKFYINTEYRLTRWKATTPAG